MNARVAVVGYADAVWAAGDDSGGGANDAERLAPVADRALAEAGIDRGEVGVVCTAGYEFGSGVIGSMMDVLDVLPCWPPVTHTHLEGDGAFAFGEAWVRLLSGEADVALVCAFSRPLAADLSQVLSLELDPYLVAPLGPRAHQIAALQARALLGAGRYTERDLAAVVCARRPGLTVEQALARPYLASPLRAPDCSTTSCAGVAAAVLAVEGKATRAAARPAWITGLDHRVESGALGLRDLTVSASTAAAAERLGLPGSAIDVLELHAPYSHQELLLVDAIGAAGIGALNPSGGVLPADPLGVSGLIRIGAAATAVMRGEADRAVGHASNGPALQHNLLCTLEAKT
jgi:acetyl-CoA acetyltransferase